MGKDLTSVRLAFVALFTLTMALMPLPASAERSLHAFLIGVEDYPVVGRLEGPSRDVCELARALIESAEIPVGNMMILTSVQACNHAEAPPTSQAQFLLRLRRFVKSLPPDATIFFAFSGHGATENGRPVLRLGDDVVSVADVIRTLAPISHSGEVVLLIDACRNTLSSENGGAGRDADDRFVREVEKLAAAGGGGKVAVLMSASPGELSWMRSYEPLSYFTWSVIKGLNGLAAGTDGAVTLADLAAYVIDDVPEMVKYDFGAIRNGALRRQKPVLYPLIATAPAITLVPRNRVEGMGFFWTAEVLIEPRDAEGRLLAEPFHTDLVTMRNGDKFDDAWPLRAREVRPGGDHTVAYPSSDLKVDRWTYLARITFGYGHFRRTFILCPDTPNVEDEVSTKMNGGTFTLNDMGAYRRWGRYLGDRDPADGVPGNGKPDFRAGRCVPTTG